jgi:hypothetical protein
MPITGTHLKLSRVAAATGLYRTQPLDSLGTSLALI